MSLWKVRGARGVGPGEEVLRGTWDWGGEAEGVVLAGEGSGAASSVLQQIRNTKYHGSFCWTKAAVELRDRDSLSGDILRESAEELFGKCLAFSFLAAWR